MHTAHAKDNMQIHFYSTSLGLPDLLLFPAMSLKPVPTVFLQGPGFRV